MFPGGRLCYNTVTARDTGKPNEHLAGLKMKGDDIMEIKEVVNKDNNWCLICF